MAAINKNDLIREDALETFRKLQILVTKNIETIEKLKRATVKLYEKKGTEQESRALKKVISLNAERIAQTREMNALETKGVALKQQLALATKAATVSQTGLNAALATMGSILKSVLGPLTIIYGIFRGIGKLKEILIKLDSFNFALQKITGSAFKTEESMRFLIKTAQDFGISLSVAADRYVKFFTAAKQAGLSVEDTRQIFSDMSKAAGVLGLKAHEVEGVFLALEQMLSKGKVTTEELRRQLGERLPGAFGVMARTVQKLNPTMIVTVQTLDDMLKKGQVLSHEVLPLFTKTYNEAFGIDKVDRVETLIAAQTRFQNSWTIMVYELENGNSYMSKGFIGAFDIMTGAITDFTETMIIFGADSTTTFEKIRNGLSTLFKNLQTFVPGGRRLFGWLEEITKINEARRQEILIDEQKSQQLRKLKDDYVKLNADIRLNVKITDLKTEADGKSREELIKINEELIRQAEALDNVTKAQQLSINYYEALVTNAKGALEALSLSDLGEDEYNKRRDAINLIIKTWEAQIKKMKGLQDKATPNENTIGWYDIEIAKLEEKLRFTGTLENAKTSELEVMKIELNLLKKKRDQLNLIYGFEKGKKDKLNKAEALEVEKIAVDSLLSRYDELIEMYERLRDATNDTILISKYQQIIDGLNESVDALLGGVSGVDVGKDILKQFGGFESAFTGQFDRFRKKSSGVFSLFGGNEKENLDQYQEYVKTTQDVDVLNFNEFLKEKEDLTEQYFDVSMQLMNQAFEFGNAIFEAQLEQIHAEMRATEEKYDAQYELAEGDKKHQKDIAKAKEQAMKKLEKEELKIRQKQAKFEKAQALANAAINIAVSITKVLAEPWLAVLVAALGAAQIATILATPLPKYKDGRLPGQDEFAIVGDGGRSEIIVGARGTRKTPSTSTLTHLDKTDMVLPSERAYKQMVLNSIRSEVNTHYEMKQIEDAIEKGFKKAQINNYLRMPKVDINIDKLIWMKQNAQFN